MSLRKASLMGAAAFFTINIGTPAKAQTATDSAPSAALQTVTVTAERRKSSVQKTAASISVRNGEDLKKQGKFSLAQILEDVPGVTTSTAIATSTASQTDQPGAAVVIRGVPPNGGGVGAGAIPTTAAYVDDVYGGIGGDYDIASVQVLRGPQGTLYGRSATAGVVATTTNNPILGKFGGEGSIEVGSYHLLHYNAALNVPITDGLAVRVAGNELQQDGYIFAKGGYHKLAEGKAKVLYQPNSDLSVLLGAAIQEQHVNSGGGRQYASVPNVAVNTNLSAKGAPIPTSTSEDHFHQYWANVNYNFGFANLTYIPAFRDWRQSTPPTVGQGPFGATNTSISSYPFDQFLTQELRLASDASSKLTWITGAYYYRNKLSSFSSTSAETLAGAHNLVVQTSLDKQTTDVGLFADASYPVTDSVSVTGGLRYDYTGVTDHELYSNGTNPFGAAGPGGVVSPSVVHTTPVEGKPGRNFFRNLTYRARVEDQFTPQNNVYATVSSGFLPGDVQVATEGSVFNPIPTAVTYAQERLTAYEIGSKNRFLDNRLQANGAVFYYDYSGYQTSVFYDLINVSFLNLTTPARMYGGELELTYRLTPDDTLSLAYNHITAQYTSQSQLNAADVGNTDIPGIAPNQVTVNYNHTFNLADGSSLDVGGDARYIDGYYYTNIIKEYFVPGQCGPNGSQACSSFDQIHAQVIGDLNLNWTSADQKYSVTGYVRNIANNQYITNDQLGGTNANGGSGFTDGVATYAPRVFGMVLNGKF